MVCEWVILLPISWICPVYERKYNKTIKESQNYKTQAMQIPLMIIQSWCFDVCGARVLMFNRLCAIWPTGYERGSLGKIYQNGDYLKQAVWKSCLPIIVRASCWVYWFKGGESSSQFQWFTIATIEL